MYNKKLVRYTLKIEPSCRIYPTETILFEQWNLEFGRERERKKREKTLFAHPIYARELTFSKNFLTPFFSLLFDRFSRD